MVSGEWVSMGFILLILGVAWWLSKSAKLKYQSLKRLDHQVFPAAKTVKNRRLSLFPPRYHFLPPLLGMAVALGLFWLVNIPLPFVIAAGVMGTVLGFLMESLLAVRRLTRIEGQLSDAIDLMVGALQAGLSLPKALEVSLKESKVPLRRYLREVVTRVQLGEDPAIAIRDLGLYIPLETFQLFSLTLSAQWWTGGSLAYTLSTVGRTIRDRIELSRRIRTQGAEAKVSVIGILAISYLLAVIMWRANPDPIEQFLASTVGSNLAAGAIGLQAVGMIWIARMSQIKF